MSTIGLLKSGIVGHRAAAAHQERICASTLKLAAARSLLAASACEFVGCVNAENVLYTVTTRSDGVVSRMMEGVYKAAGGGQRKIRFLKRKSGATLEMRPPKSGSRQ